MTKPAHPNSRERIADRDERAAAEALANRKQPGWEKHWARLLDRDHRYMAGETYLQDCEARASRYASGGSERVDRSRDASELAWLIRAERIARVEAAVGPSPLILAMWSDAVLGGMTAVQLAETHLRGHTLGALKHALSMVDSRASWRDVSTRYARKAISDAAERAADALRDSS